MKYNIYLSCFPGVWGREPPGCKEKREKTKQNKTKNEQKGKRLKLKEKKENWEGKGTIRKKEFKIMQEE